MKSVFSVKGAKEKHRGAEGSHKQGEFDGQCPIEAIEGFPGGSDNKKSTCNAGNLGSVPGLGRFPWRRAWQTTPVFLPGESPWTEEPGVLQSTGSQRVRHN